MKEEKLILGHFYNKSPIYVISVIFMLWLLFFLESKLFTLFFIITVGTYLWAHVFVDTNVKKYPSRIILFPRYSITDFIRFAYSLKGSIKYKCLVLF